MTPDNSRVVPLSIDDSKVVPMMEPPTPFHTQRQQWSDHGLERPLSELGVRTVVVPAVGEVWYVKLPGATALSEAKVYDVTVHTVELGIGYHFVQKARYETHEVKFVERKCVKSGT